MDVREADGARAKPRGRERREFSIASDQRCDESRWCVIGVRLRLLTLTRRLDRRRCGRQWVALLGDKHSLEGVRFRHCVGRVAGHGQCIEQQPPAGFVQRIKIAQLARDVGRVAKASAIDRVGDGAFSAAREDPSQPHAFAVHPLIELRAVRLRVRREEVAGKERDRGFHVPTIGRVQHQFAIHFDRRRQSEYFITNDDVRSERLAEFPEIGSHRTLRGLGRPSSPEYLLHMRSHGAAARCAGEIGEQRERFVRAFVERALVAVSALHEAAFAEGVQQQRWHRCRRRGVRRGWRIGGWRLGGWRARCGVFVVHCARLWRPDLTRASLVVPHLCVVFDGIDAQ